VVYTLGNNALGSAALAGSGATAMASLTVFGAQVLAANNSIEASFLGSPLFTASSATTTLTLGTPSATSAETLSVTPSPVAQQAPNANGATFFFTVKLSETAGVSTTITGFSFAGMSYAGSIAHFFGSNTLPAHGTLTANLSAGNIPVPASEILVLSGMDASGATWTQQVSISFVN
jgi:hypothetical protein